MGCFSDRSASWGIAGNLRRDRAMALSRPFDVSRNRRERRGANTRPGSRPRNNRIRNRVPTRGFLDFLTEILLFFHVRPSTFLGTWGGRADFGSFPLHPTPRRPVRHRSGGEGKSRREE